MYGSSLAIRITQLRHYYVRIIFLSIGHIVCLTDEKVTVVELQTILCSAYYK